MSDDPKNRTQPLPQVASVLHLGIEVVINKGATHGIQMNQRFQIYGLGDEVNDPASGASLGQLELLRGTGRVAHLQATMATIKSDMWSASRQIIREIPRSAMIHSAEKVTETIPGELKPFEGVQMGDFARPI